MNEKLTRYYDVQEMHDDLTYKAKLKAQQELDMVDKRENAVEILKDIFPNANATEVLQEIENKMETFIAIGHQYKLDIEGESLYKDVLRVAMGEILLQLNRYEFILHYMYPHMSHFFHSLQLWYEDYLTDCSADAKA